MKVERIWVPELIKTFKLYAVTSIRRYDHEILKKIERAYRGGADIVQVRSKDLSDRELYDLGLKVRKLADQYKKLYFVNDRLDIALLTDADGIHIGQDDLPISEVRQLIRESGKKLRIGKSTHSIQQAVQAVSECPDYIGVGPVFSTPTKPDYRPVGLDLITQVSKKKFPIPFVAIGGIDAENVEQVLDAGADRIAVVRGIFDSLDIEGSTRRLKEYVEFCLKKS